MIKLSNSIYEFDANNEMDFKAAIELSQYLEDHPEVDDIMFRFDNNGDYSGRYFNRLLRLI